MGSGEREEVHTLGRDQGLVEPQDLLADDDAGPTAGRHGVQSLFERGRQAVEYEALLWHAWRRETTDGPQKIKL